MAQETFGGSCLHSRVSPRVRSRWRLWWYWRHPGRGNRPGDYISGEARSRFLVGLMDKYAAKDASIAELGCNVGRNLNQLRLAGYSRLCGVDINPHALAEMRRAYPELARVARIINAPIEDAIRTFAVRQFDVVFSMAVLEHVHPDSGWIFPEIARVVGRVLITIEDETAVSWRHVPRNYQSVFEPLGLRQVEVVNCRDVERLGPDFNARVFKVKD